MVTKPRMLICAAMFAVAAAACGDDDTATTPGTTTTTITTTTAVPTTTTDGAGDEPIVVTVDGELVPLRTACTGADDAVVTIAAGTDRRIILVREEGLALRIGTEGGTFSETDDVETASIGERTRYSGTIPVEGQPTPVTMEIADEIDLPDC